MMAEPNTPNTQIDLAKLDAITPSQYIRFKIPNILNHRQLLHDPVVHVSVCDSPLANANDDYHVIAAMIVPKNREIDWNYTTEFGHLQLLFKFRYVSRLILLSNPPPHLPPLDYKRPSNPDTVEEQRVQDELKPLLIYLHPKVSFRYGTPETLFLKDEDDVAYRVTLHDDMNISSPFGSILVEDVELVGTKQLRRRLRCRKMPRVAQSEVLLVPKINDEEGAVTTITQTDLGSLRKIKTVRFKADTSVLVQQYLISMVSGLFLIASYLDSVCPERALCIGVGGGVLLSFLDRELEFEVTGVEVDGNVEDAGIEYFGLNHSGGIRIIIGDAIETIQNFPPRKYRGVTSDDKFDVVFVDLYSSEAQNGFSAPPKEFVKKAVFEGVKSLLDEHGVLIMNVVPFDVGFYTTLLKEVKEVFHKVYEINVGNEENFVVMATVSPTLSGDNDSDNGFLNKLKSVIPATYFNSIVEL